MSHRLLSDHEECRTDVDGLEKVEQGGRPVRHRAVIKGPSDASEHRGSPVDGDGWIFGGQPLQALDDARAWVAVAADGCAVGHVIFTPALAAYVVALLWWEAGDERRRKADGGPRAGDEKPATLRAEAATLKQRETLQGPQGGGDTREYLVWHNTGSRLGPAGRYLVRITARTADGQETTGICAVSVP